MPQPNRYRTYFDEAWKKVIERFFPPFLLFFAPKLYQDVDFSKRFTFLDKELGQLSKAGAAATTPPPEIRCQMVSDTEVV